MKTIDAEGLAHIAQHVTTLCMCWKLTRTDATVLAFTDYHDSLEIDGITYQAQSGTIKSTAVSGTSDLSVPDMEVETLLDSDAITSEDIMAGRYDYAELHIFMVNYLEPEDFAVKLLRGKLGEVSLGYQSARAEARGMINLLKQRTGRTHESICQYELGNAACGVNIENFAINTTIATVTSAREFTIAASAADGVYTHGKIKFTSGDNLGISMEIKAQTGSSLTLSLPMPFPVHADDTVRVYMGCDKKWKTCKEKFDCRNFSGFPHIPGTDAVYSVGKVSP